MQSKKVEKQHSCLYIFVKINLRLMRPHRLYGRMGLTLYCLALWSFEGDSVQSKIKKKTIVHKLTSNTMKKKSQNDKETIE